MRFEPSGLRIGRRDRRELDRLLATARDASLIYDHVGSTLRAESAPGVPNRVISVDVAGDLASATRALRRWAAHEGIHARIHPHDAPLTVGSVLLVVAPFGPFEISVPDRIVGVVDEPDRFGFAYGTLAGHAETGEESFLAEQIASGQLRLTVRVHARGATLLARLGTPVLVVVQRAAAKRYVAAWAAAIAAEGT